MAFVSCTNDEEDTTDNKSKIPSYADYPGDTGGGQSGQTPIPPPKP
ncbi:hypothetical protein [Flavobacterium sp. HTF]|nr:hypothetical protein [Flavobacterium sp. HTF]